MSGRQKAVGVITVAFLICASAFVAAGKNKKPLDKPTDLTGGGSGPLVSSSTTGAVIPGDANCDGEVDVGDYTIWFNHYGQAGRWTDGDFTGDGMIDVADYTVWFNNYGRRVAPVGIVTNVKVMSDRNPQDVSSPAAWKKSFVTPGMTDRQIAAACWRTMVMYQFQDSVPKEYLQYSSNIDGDPVCDPLKMANVYGYSFCSVVASEVAALARYAGLEARNRALMGHNVCELKWSNTFHMYDSSLINWFTTPDDNVASVDTIIRNITDWYATHPGYKDNTTNLNNFRNSGQWKTSGPSLLASCTFYSSTGWWPAGTHSWSSTMQEYDGDDSHDWEDTSSMGYTVNLQLRPGEVITRNWSNIGLHINGPGNNPYALTGTIGKGQMVYCPNYGDLANGRIGNGTHVYTVPLSSADFEYSAWRFDNLATQGKDGRTPALHLSDTSSSGVLEIRMPSSYVYLTGALNFNATISAGGQIDVKFSDNNGTSWKNVATYTTGGAKSFDLKSLCFRRYDYRLKFTISGAGSGISTMSISHDIQHSQRPLPALGQGDNTITFTSLPQESTLTIEGCGNTGNAANQIIYTDYAPATNNLLDSPPGYNGAGCYLMHTISAPGDIKKVRINSFYRAREPGDRWEIGVSYDGGATFRQVGTCSSYVASNSCKDLGNYIEVTDVPLDVRSVKVRWLGFQSNTLRLFNHRIDADYVPPNVGFKPVQITYQWIENGVTKSNVHVANTPNEVYHINCSLKPVMKSISLQLAP